MSDIFIDRVGNVHFAYYDLNLLKPVYVIFNNGVFSYKDIGTSRNRGEYISITTNTSFAIEAFYIDDIDGSIWYANNALNSMFNIIQVDNRKNIKVSKLMPLISSYDKPVLFFLDNMGRVSVSRYTKNQFITQYLYTNSKIKNIEGISTSYGYMLFMEEYESGNVFLATKKSNEAFVFHDKSPLITNVFSFSVSLFSLPLSFHCFYF